MKKFGIAVLAAAMISTAMSVTAFAGSWKQSSTGWQYTNDDGSESKAQWQQIGGAWYYFGENAIMAANQWIGNYYVGADGAMLTNTTTPDGYQVGADGAWIQGAAASKDTASEDSSDKEEASYDTSINGTVSGRLNGNGITGFSIDDATNTITLIGNPTYKKQQIGAGTHSYRINPGAQFFVENGEEFEEVKKAAFINAVNGRMGSGVNLELSVASGQVMEIYVSYY